MSIVDLPARKPHCDSGQTRSASFCSRVKMTFAKIVNNAEKGDAMKFLQSLLSPLFLKNVMISASLVSCGTAVLQCLIRSGGILSEPGALPEAKLSMALLSSSKIGSVSSSSMVGRSLWSSGRSSVPPISPTDVLYP